MLSLNNLKQQLWLLRRRIFIFLAVFGPATITSMADNDAAGVTTYMQAGARLGYPILFVLIIITVLLGITQEMGIRLSIVSRKGLGDHIREQYGLKTAILVFAALFLANIGTIIADVSAIKVTSSVFNLPPLITTIVFLAVASFIVIRGNYKINQGLMLFSCLFFFTFIFSAVKARPDWGMAISNLFIPHGVAFDSKYILDYVIISMGVLGTTVTPWGQFFISSFSFDKNIDPKKLKYSQLETYIGAFLTDFFTFFMIVAPAATLFIYGISVMSGAEAALAIKPFAGELAAYIFAVGILNAGFLGMVIVSLSTAYAFSEFFGVSGSLDAAYKRGKTFYMLFLLQIAIAFFVIIIPKVNLFSIAIVTQIFNAMVLPLIFYFLVKFTDNPQLMGTHTNSGFQRNFALGSIFVILAASLFTVVVSIFNL